jgi:hypothetical protein
MLGKCARMAQKRLGAPKVSQNGKNDGPERSARGGGNSSPRKTERAKAQGGVRGGNPSLRIRGLGD